MTTGSRGLDGAGDALKSKLGDEPTSPVHIGPEISPAMGEQPLVVTLSNEGPGPCVLEGYPRLRLVASADTALNLPQVTHSQYLLATVAHPVILAVGAFAYVAIAKYRCDLGALQVPSQLRLTLPGASAGTALTVSGRVISGRDLCKGGPSDPGNVIAVTPVGPRWPIPCLSSAS